VTDREKIIRALFARATAAGRRVFGYSSDRAGCSEAATARRKGKGRGDTPEDAGIVPDEWDRACVEGDRHWTVLPPAKEAEPGANKEL
jgi:hypothetical protein